MATMDATTAPPRRRWLGGKESFSDRNGITYNVADGVQIYWRRDTIDVFLLIRGEHGWTSQVIDRPNYKVWDRRSRTFQQLVNRYVRTELSA